MASKWNSSLTDGGRPLSQTTAPVLESQTMATLTRFLDSTGNLSRVPSQVDPGWPERHNTGMKRMGHVSRSVNRWSRTAHGMPRRVARAIATVVDESFLYP
jgi:hypothetical protein